MDYLLADLGNSRVKLRWLGEEQVEALDWRDARCPARLREILRSRGAVRMMAASTSPEGRTCWDQVVPAEVESHWLEADQLPLEVLSRGTGLDRLLASWAAHGEFGQAVLVADLGTAWTLDVLDSRLRFHGGCIGAGLGLQRQALREACPHLAQGKAQEGGIPKDTAAAVDGGTRRAFLAGLLGLAAEFEAELGEPAVRVLCGGDAQAVRGDLPGWEYRPDLVLDGLAHWASLRFDLG